VSAESGWGSVIPNTDTNGLQATSWVARVEGSSSASEAPLFLSTSPALTKAAALRTSGKDPVKLDADGYLLGIGQSIETRAKHDAFLQSIHDNEYTDAGGVSYASSYAASLDIGTPYIANTNGGIQLSSIGVHLEGVTATAISIPGKSVRFGVKAN
ncbi:hypothetical protein BGZ76_008416, partial [Entomortierella beljakovae]